MEDSIPVWTEKTIARVWKRVDMNGPICATPDAEGPCHIWTGSTINGYGQCGCFFGKETLMHRIVLTMELGKMIPKGMVACHLCNVRLCCNPAHIKLGTRSENAMDAVRAGKAKPRQRVIPCMTNKMLKERKEELERGGMSAKEARHQASRERTLEHITKVGTRRMGHMDNDCDEVMEAMLDESSYHLQQRQLWWKGRLRSPCQIVLEIANGQPIPKGMVVLHACDNPRCVKLSHISIGTQKDNIHDMHRKGRASTHNAKKKGTDS